MNGYRIRMLAGLLCLLAAGTAYAQADAADGWNSGYVGVSGGYGAARIGGTDIRINNAIGSATSDGAVIGAQAGCDHQFADWVVGAQLAVGKGFQKGSHRYVNGSGPSNQVTYSVNYLATLTGRVGYLLQPQTLAYLKAGGAMTRTDHNDTDPAPLFGVPYTGSSEVTRSGWLVGVGVERKIGNGLSGFVEFDYMDFGRKDVTIAYSDGVVATYAFKQQMSYLGLGVNYRF